MTEYNPVQPNQTFRTVLATSRDGGSQTSRDYFQLFLIFFFLNTVIKLLNINKTNVEEQCLSVFPKHTEPVDVWETVKGALDKGEN